MRLEVVEAREHEGVPKDKLRAACRSLKEDPLRGKPLGGRLIGCYSIRVAGSENRLVYMYSQDQDEVTILAIGRRRDSEVYKTAKHRVAT